ncbi:MAG: Asp/Glu racemase [Hyphomicrobiales bacterium]
MMKQLSFLHTAKVNDELFKNLMAGRNVEHRHVLRDDLLNRAEEAGEFTEELNAQTQDVLTELAADADAVLLTCSTLGPAADALGRPDILRIDRALAEQAVKGGGSVAVLVAVETTIEPTKALFEEAAAKTGALIELVMVEGAWPRFRAGDFDAYAAKIADCARAQTADVIALAQASMAPAAALVPEKMVLSSPDAGLAAALKLLG